MKNVNVIALGILGGISAIASTIIVYNYGKIKYYEGGADAVTGLVKDLEQSHGELSTVKK